MQHIFMDESGSIGFSTGSTAYFVLALTAPDSGKQLSKCIKNFNAHLIRNGWNPKVEIKASNVWHAPKNEDIPETYKYKRNPAVPMKHILAAIADIPGRVECALIKMDTLAPGLKKIPNCILYNYFSWHLLENSCCLHPAIELSVDRRNREYHDQLKFDGYIEGTAAVARANKSLPALNLKIHHLHWNSANDERKAEERPKVQFRVRGIEAADFICWAIKRKYENQDDQWFKIIEKLVKCKKCMFFDEK